MPSPHTRLCEPATQQQGKHVYCARCLRELFNFYKDDLNKLNGAGTGECPRCEGHGALFVK